MAGFRDTKYQIGPSKAVVRVDWPIYSRDFSYFNIHEHFKFMLS